MKLALEINDSGIKISLYRRKWRGWVHAQRAEIPWKQELDQAPLGEQLIAALRPSLLLWGVKPDTTVIVVPDRGIGGVLTGPLKAAKATKSEVETLLKQYLPYPLTEIAWVQRVVGTGAFQKHQIAWIPVGWLAELRDALTRVGLRLDEVYPAAFLVPAALGKPIGESLLWVHQAGRLATIWTLRPGAYTDAAIALDLSLQGAESRLAMTLMTVDDNLPVVVSGESEDFSATVTRLIGDTTTVTPVDRPRLHEQLFKHWLAGERGWWQAPPADWLVSRTMPWLIALAILALSAMGFLTWQRQHLADETAKLDDTVTKMTPAYRRLAAKQRELFQLTGQLLDSEGYDHAKPALNVLAVMSDVLPDGSWLTRYQFDGKQYHVEGQGISDKDLSARLAKAGYVAVASKPLAPIAAVTNASNPTAQASLASAPIQFVLDIHEQPSPKAKNGH